MNGEVIQPPPASLPTSVVKPAMQKRLFYSLVITRNPLPGNRKAIALGASVLRFRFRPCFDLNMTGRVLPSRQTFLG